MSILSNPELAPFVLDVSKALDKSPFVYTTESDPKELTAFYAGEKFKGSKITLDMTGVTQTFRDDFMKPSVTLASGAGPWFSASKNSGLHGGFGGAVFVDDAFIFADGNLTIRMSQKNGAWVSGLMQTVNAKGVGFQQKYGIFEMRAKFQPGVATWEGFWLKTANQYTDPTQPRLELDVIEAYGGDPKGYHAAVHLWAANKPKPGALLQKSFHPASVYCGVDPVMFDGQFHTYTAEVSPHYIRVFYDRKLVAKFPMLPEFRKPLFMLANLALNTPKEVRTDTNPSDMTIDYIAAWQRPEWALL